MNLLIHLEIQDKEGEACFYVLKELFEAKIDFFVDFFSRFQHRIDDICIPCFRLNLLCCFVQA